VGLLRRAHHAAEQGRLPRPARADQHADLSLRDRQIDPAQHQLAGKYEIDFDCNWKFGYENLLDIYHVGTTHAKAIGKFQDEASYRFNAQPEGRLGIAYQTQTMTPDGKTRVGKMPWLESETERFGRIGYHLKRVFGDGAR